MAAMMAVAAAMTGCSIPAIRPSRRVVRARISTVSATSASWPSISATAARLEDDGSTLDCLLLGWGPGGPLVDCVPVNGSHRVICESIFDNEGHPYWGPKRNLCTDGARWGLCTDAAGNPLPFVPDPSFLPSHHAEWLFPPCHLSADGEPVTACEGNPADPDLVVTAASYTPLAPEVGDRVDLTVTIRNNGPQPAPNTRFTVTFSGGQVSRQAHYWVGSLTAGGERSLPVSSLDAGYAVSGGANDVNIVVDSFAELVESREDNNTRQLSFTGHPAPPGGIDLRVTALAASPEVPVEGRQAVVSFEVVNGGSVAAPGVRYKVSLGAPSQMPVENTVNIGPLAAGARHAEDYAFVGEEPGSYSIRVEADPGNAILESSEVNNVSVTTVTFVADEPCLPCTSGEPGNAVGATLCAPHSNPAFPPSAGAQWICRGVRADGTTCVASGNHPNGWGWNGPRCPDPASLPAGWHQERLRQIRASVRVRQRRPREGCPAPAAGRAQPGVASFGKRSSGVRFSCQFLAPVPPGALSPSEWFQPLVLKSCRCQGSAAITTSWPKSETAAGEEVRGAHPTGLRTESSVGCASRTSSSASRWLAISVRHLPGEVRYTLRRAHGLSIWLQHSPLKIIMPSFPHITEYVNQVFSKEKTRLDYIFLRPPLLVFYFFLRLVVFPLKFLIHRVPYGFEARCIDGFMAFGLKYLATAEAAELLVRHVQIEPLLYRYLLSEGPSEDPRLFNGIAGDFNVRSLRDIARNNMTIGHDELSYEIIDRFDKGKFLANLEQIRRLRPEDHNALSKEALEANKKHSWKLLGCTNIVIFIVITITVFRRPAEHDQGAQFLRFRFRGVVVPQTSLSRQPGSDDRPGFLHAGLQQP